MKTATILAGMLIAGTAAALEAQPDYSSPYDKNRHCAERTVDANSPECIIQSEGTPRQTYPPRDGQAKPPAPPTPPTPAPAAPPTSAKQAPRQGASK